MREVERSATYLLRQPLRLERAQKNVENERQRVLQERFEGKNILELLLKGQSHVQRKNVEERLSELGEHLQELDTGCDIQEHVAKTLTETPTLHTARLDRWLEDTGICDLVEGYSSDKQIEIMMREKLRIIRTCIAQPFIRMLERKGRYDKLWKLADEGIRWDGADESSLKKIAINHVALSLGGIMQIGKEHQ